MTTLRTRYLPLLEAEYFSLIDVHLAEELLLREGREDELLYLAALSVSRCAREKHVCLDLSHIPLGEFPDGDAYQHILVYPDAAVWRKALKKCVTVGSPEKNAPLILDGTLLYLQKYYRYETTIAESLRSGSALTGFDGEILSGALTQLFPGSEDPDWQKCAVINGALRKFSVVTGGPGTGKTTTAAKILLLLVYQSLRKGIPCRAALCAPTGKAAAHLHSSISDAVARAEHDGAASLVEYCRTSLPERSFTIHRLLGSIPGSPRFRHNAENPLPHEIVIVDEVSMADAALTAKLVEAVRPDAHLIFLGDMDQLSSVEAGSVLGDICDRRGQAPYDTALADAVSGFGVTIPSSMIAPSGGIRGSIVYLKRSRRFSSDSDLGKCAALVNEGKGGDARAAAGGDGTFVWHELALPDHASVERLSAECAAVIAAVAGLDTPGTPLYRWSDTQEPEEFFSALSRFQLLCALRRGVYGSERCASLVEDLLIERGYLSSGREFRHGQAIIVTRNDHALKLYNGDVGVICKTGSGILRAYFRDHEKGNLRSLSPHQLPAHQSAFALTVHKSQGSEYDNVLLMLPGTDSPVVTRELIYTGITRAKKSCIIAGKAGLFDTAVARRIERASALHERLWL